jgi:hypothetical protein
VTATGGWECWLSLITGAGSNASARLEGYVAKGGAYTAGIIPEVEDLFQRQVREPDPKKREAMLHQIQQILYDRTVPRGRRA